ncbi:MAG: hypothetical protein FJ276_34825 [Planctomycetes bacterium]|nr:hypothetical protein [Planctomycetota bacterium]
MATANIVGNIPEPDQLYGRDELIANLWRQIRNNNVLLLAPRRFGKSGVMRHVLLRPSPGFLPVYLDLEDVDSPQEFVWRVTRELLSHDKLRECLQSARRLPAIFQDWITGTFEEAEFEGARVKFKDALAQDWHTAARRLLLEMEKARETLLFIFDYYRTRLRRYGDAGERSAIAMLRAVAEAPHGRASASALYDVYRKTRKRGASEQEFDELVADLECDWYLALDVRTNEYYFLVEVMRDWWLRWYGSRRRQGQSARRK